MTDTIADRKKDVWAIIPASGIGARMQAAIPKQYLKFQNKTILEHCLNRLLSHPSITGLIVVLRQDDPHWKDLTLKTDKALITALGGEQRHHSVFNGLSLLKQQLKDESLVLIHDAVRPLVTHVDIDRVISAARDNSSGAILASQLSDTLKRQDEMQLIESTVNRERLWKALTPQVFQFDLLYRALSKVIDEGLNITDDASAIEAMDLKPALVEGCSTNLKITKAQDLRLAELIWLDQRN